MALARKKAAIANKVCRESGKVKASLSSSKTSLCARASQDLLQCFDPWLGQSLKHTSELDSDASTSSLWSLWQPRPAASNADDNSHEGRDAQCLQKVALSSPCSHSSGVQLDVREPIAISTVRDDCHNSVSSINSHSGKDGCGEAVLRHCNWCMASASRPQG